MEGCSLLSFSFCSMEPIDGQAYTGNVPLTADNPSIIRQVNTAFPNEVPATLLSLVVPTRLQLPSWLMSVMETPSLFHGRVLILASIFFLWTYLFAFKVLIVVYFKWPHNTGPMLTYLADRLLVITSAKWFKIDQIGRTSFGSAWAQADLSTFSQYDLSLLL